MLKMLFSKGLYKVDEKGIDDSYLKEVNSDGSKRNEANLKYVPELHI